MSDREKLKAQREHTRNGILAEIALALTPGSPAYVRELRDRAAVTVLPALIAWAGNDYKNRKQDKLQLGMLAEQQANALIEALGYEVPGEEGEDD